MAISKINFQGFATRAFKEKFCGGNLPEAEFRIIRSYFEGRCIWCNILIANAQDVHERQDHFIPIREFGLTVPGNIVLACNTCDDSRTHKAYKTLKDWVSKKSEKYKGDSRRDFSLSAIRNRIKRWKDWKAEQGESYQFYADWFEDLPEDLKNDFQAVLKAIGDLDVRASEVAERIKGKINNL